ncbi:MAG: hypothetical protein K0Q72_4434 [Armatimonadetes bacterium]|jgi:Tfp pilus assembly protein PilV|nr:hypothetical protein [Armatimonadota bacterium]
MRSRFSLRTNRRAFTLIEVGVSSFILVLVLSGVLGIMNTAARLEQSVLLQQGTDSQAALAMNRMVNDIREAKRVEVVNAYQFRIYYPVVRADGNYDRFVTDTAHYVQYARTTATGQVNASGGYLWKSTDLLAGSRIAKDLTNLTVSLQGNNAIRLSLRIQKSGVNRSGDTQLNERVLYLRNY